MKCVMLATRPKWCEKICREIGKDRNGKPIYEKSTEVRKTKPSIPTPFKVYIYETYDEKYASKGILWENGTTFVHGCRKVIGEFICDEVEEISCLSFVVKGYEIDTCLTYKEFYKYGKGKSLYGWHITDLKIYDTPKELSEFQTAPCEKSERACGRCKYLVIINTPDMYETDCYVSNGRQITRPPQSWCYVQE